MWKTFGRQEGDWCGQIVRLGQVLTFFLPFCIMCLVYWLSLENKTKGSKRFKRQNFFSCASNFLSQSMKLLLTTTDRKNAFAMFGDEFFCVCIRSWLTVWFATLFDTNFCDMSFSFHSNNLVPTFYFCKFFRLSPKIISLTLPHLPYVKVTPLTQWKMYKYIFGTFYRAHHTT